MYSSEASSSFTDALVKEKSLQLEPKKTSTEKKREKRKVQREITKKVSECFAVFNGVYIATNCKVETKQLSKALTQCEFLQPPVGQWCLGLGG